MSLDGVIYIVRLFELLVDDITINDTRRITWPKLVSIPKQPSIDGVLMLYDVTDEESINEIPDILCKSGLTLCISGARSSFTTAAPERYQSVLPLSTFLANRFIPDALSKLISCKEDNPPQLRQVDLDFNDQIKSRLPLVETCSTSANVPESQKRCISLILRSILKGRRGKPLLAFFQAFLLSHLRYCFFHPAQSFEFIG